MAFAHKSTLGGWCVGHSMTSVTHGTYSTRDLPSPPRDGLDFVSEMFDACGEVFLEAVGLTFSECGQLCPVVDECLGLYDNVVAKRGRGNNNPDDVEAEVTRALAHLRDVALRKWWRNGSTGGRNGNGEEKVLEQGSG